MSQGLDLFEAVAVGTVFFFSLFLDALNLSVLIVKAVFVKGKLIK